MKALKGPVPEGVETETVVIKKKDGRQCEAQATFGEEAKDGTCIITIWADTIKELVVN